MHTCQKSVFGVSGGILLSGAQTNNETSRKVNLIGESSRNFEALPTKMFSHTGEAIEQLFNSALILKLKIASGHKVTACSAKTTINPSKFAMIYIPNTIGAKISCSSQQKPDDALREFCGVFVQEKRQVTIVANQEGYPF